MIGIFFLSGWLLYKIWYGKHAILENIWDTGNERVS